MKHVHLASTSASRLAEARAELDRVRRALRELPRAGRRVFVMSELEGRSCNEIAEILGLSVAVARSRLDAAREVFERYYRVATQSSLHGLVLTAVLLASGCETVTEGHDHSPWTTSIGSTGSSSDDGDDAEEVGSESDADTDDDGGTSTSGDAPSDDGPPPGDGSTTDSNDGDPVGDVPDTPHCQPVADWDPSWAKLEEDALALVNQHRAQGASCGGAGSFGSAPPLIMEPRLRCAARRHAKDMHERNFFDHVNPSGQDPGQRIQQTGYTFSGWGENIAGGAHDAALVVSDWMASPGHCAQLMDDYYAETGMGFYPGGPVGTLWTQVFARP
jgi:uncharacterized protein YkwD